MSISNNIEIPADMDEAFRAEDAQKSNLILEAKLLREQKRPEEAAEKFAQAAAIEERLAETCLMRGWRQLLWIHLYSAARGWALAGNCHSAILLGEKMLSQPDLPEELRQQVEEWMRRIRQLRAQMMVEQAKVSMAKAG